MVLPMLALAKLNLLSHSQSLSPLLTSLVLPFVLKLSLNSRLFRRTYIDVIHASRLFFFQLRQIAFGAEPALGNNSRLERAIRLVFQRVNHARRPAAPQTDEDSFHALSMFAL